MSLKAAYAAPQAGGAHFRARCISAWHSRPVLPARFRWWMLYHQRRRACGQQRYPGFAWSGGRRRLLAFHHGLGSLPSPRNVQYWPEHPPSDEGGFMGLDPTRRTGAIAQRYRLWPSWVTTLRISGTDCNLQRVLQGRREALPEAEAGAFRRRRFRLGPCHQTPLALQVHQGRHGLRAPGCSRRPGVSQRGWRRASLTCPQDPQASREASAVPSPESSSAQIGFFHGPGAIRYPGPRRLCCILAYPAETVDHP